ncbi:Trs33p, partial [Rhodotorula paludigena]|uniref:Trs33p n=1 Tax=Rhodotorula paludigena TaxID=86838 RepID=UPI0031776BC6
MATNRPLHALVTSSGHPHNRSSSSLLSPAVSALADPPAHSADARLVDLVHAELIRTLQHSQRAATARARADHALVEDQLAQLGLAPLDKGKARATTEDTPNAKAEQAQRDEADDAVRSRLDSLGFKVGWATAERLARDRPRFPTTASTLSTSSSSASPALAPSPSHSPHPSASSPSPTPAHAPVPDALELVKFVCKDVWTAMYDKQVDNLRTNHRGVFVVVDHSLRPLRGVATGGGGGGGGGGAEDKEEEREAQRWVRFVLAFPAGVIRGALANLGLQCTVSGESPAVPQ